ncbi:hypothetical protein [Leptolyngbya sp. 7M]|nr:hypothetical protein [Leptolyngbya sp. 7M]QYO65128.1 hypothetical protein JVX88_37465 [Leptolyngbya sp. 7M]
MPEHPADWISDLVKMGVYKPAALDLANNLTQVEMREALLLQRLAIS